MSTALGCAGLILGFPCLADASTLASQLYTIASGNLGNALDTFAAQSNVQLVYSPELATGKTTRGVSGRFTPAEALRQLLAGTGLTWKAVNDTTFVLKPLPALQPVPAAPPAADVSAAPAKTLRTVSVSGSLISNAAIQTATPTYTITAEDIKARGFNSIADVLLNSVLATGSVQGPQAAGTFTQGAQPISLFGLSPQLTLILIDGKQLADFGPLYNGALNVTSVANLPVAIVDHIDVMPGGASSIYGSQAIGGVINIVTKSQMDGGDLSLRTGNYSDGGGANQRLSFAYGHTTGKLRLLAAGEFDNASPIWGYQRPLTMGSDSGPAGVGAPTVQAAIYDYGTASTSSGYPLGYLNPPNGCDTHLFGGSTQLVSSSNADQYGHYCGSDKAAGDVTYSNQERNYDGMLKLDYQVSEQLQLYSDTMLNWQQQSWFPGAAQWASIDYPDGLIEDATTGHILYLGKTFAPEEMPGGLAGQMYRQNDLLYQGDLGANGQLGESDWDWDIYYLRTGDRTTVVEPVLMKAQVDSYFNSILGPLVGVDPVTRLNTYNPDYAAFFEPVSPAQYASFSQGVPEFSNTWINDTRATLSNASLFGLPGGDAGFAALIEGGNEAWYEPVNPLFTQGAVFDHAASGGGGQRAHAATSFELNLPLLKPLTLDLSGRYDHYALNEGSNNHKFTYKTGLEYRPVDGLLFRGNYTTSFKAPDLSSIFLGPTGYYTQIIDYYQCAKDHSNNCGADDQYEVKGTALANPALQPTTAESWTLGSVWSPVDSFSVSLDYLHLAIRDEVVQQSVDLLMRTDAQCLLGELNPDSAECQAITNPVDGQVQRAGKDGDGTITGITTYYANLTDEMTESIIGSAHYHFAPWHIGSFSVQLDYNDMLRHEYQLAPGQAPINQLADPQYSEEFKSILSGSVTWNSPGGRWTGTVYGHRYGPSPNYIAQNDGATYPGAGRLPPWITFNGSVSYHLTRQLDLSALVNNITNKMPPVDPTYSVYPYFNVENYNIYGREVMLQMDLTFGSAMR
ncbi:TonB-dependent receptor [Dyella flava]|nr:TonB-dependent receptor [Dyella flava]